MKSELSKPNELKMIFFTCAKALSSMENYEKRGVRLFKGTPDEVRMSYKQALAKLDTLNKYFAEKGCFSKGICKDCASGNTNYYSNKEFAKCEARNMEMKSIYDTCDKFTER